MMNERPGCAAPRRGAAIAGARHLLPWLSFITTLAVWALAESAHARHHRASRHAVRPSSELPAPTLAARILEEDPLVSNSEALTLTLTVDGLSGADEPALSMEVNGRPATFAVLSRPASAARGQPRRGEWSLRVAAPPVDCVVTATASFGGRSAFSSPLRVLRNDVMPSSPRLFALVIGVSGYADKRLDLRFAAKDARDFEKALRAGVASVYSKVEFTLMTDGEATRERVRAGIAWLEEKVSKEDVAVVFLAGHGMQEPGSGRYYFLPHDADVRALPATALGQEEFTALRGRIPGRLLLFLDSCHAGAVMHKSLDDPLPRELLSEISGQAGSVVVFASAAGPQAARESQAWGNGAFTRALVEGLHGRADFNRSGTVSVSELELYVSERVRSLTYGSQSPVSAKPFMVPDFTIAAVPLSTPTERDSAATTGYAPLILAAVVCGLVAAMRRRPAYHQLSLPMLVTLRNSIDLFSSRASRSGLTPRPRVDRKSLLLRSIESGPFPAAEVRGLSAGNAGRHRQGRPQPSATSHAQRPHDTSSSTRITIERPSALRGVGQRLRSATQGPLLRTMDPSLRGSGDLAR